MEILHRHLGVVSYTADDVITFPLGLLGFLKFKKYLFLQPQEYLPFQWMVSIENPEVAFVLMNPSTCCADYNPNITRRDLNELSAENPQSLEMYSIVTMNLDARLATVNLSGPILVNKAMKIGKQLVLLDDRYSTKHRIIQS